MAHKDLQVLKVLPVYKASKESLVHKVVLAHRAAWDHKEPQVLKAYKV